METNIIVYEICKHICYQDFITKSGKQMRFDIGLYYVSKNRFNNMKDVLIKHHTATEEYIRHNIFIDDPIGAMNHCEKLNEDNQTALLNLLDDDIE